MIKLENVSKSYNHHDFVVNSVSLHVPTGKTLVLLGSSGSGKTTLLKMINRLIKPTSGDILINGTNIKQIPNTQLRRSIGYVFQGVGLFPHMTIERNVSIGLELLGGKKSTRQQRAHELLELVHLDPSSFADRYPDELSGGQQQRVGVARALASDPDCLLMDEPFGALDAISRDTLQNEILELNEELNKTIVFVTHDINEAFKLADIIGIMHKGKLQQLGTPEQIRANPKTSFVDTLLDTFHQQQMDSAK